MRKEFGIGVRELYTEMPDWEVETLLKEWNREQEKLQRQARRK